MCGKNTLYRKNKKTRICLFAAITALSIFTVTASAASQVILQPSSRIIFSGDTVTIDIVVKPDTEIAGMQFDLKFDGSLLQVTNVTEGNLFKQSGMETLFNPGQTDTGTLKNVYGCVLGKEGVSTSGTFATVTLSSASGGKNTARIYLQNVTISNQEGNAVETEVKNTSIRLLKTRGKDNSWKELTQKMSDELALKRTKTQSEVNNRMANRMTYL